MKTGDHCEIDPTARIECDDFECGDYVKIHRNVWIRGARVRIGHCGWVGQDVILDGTGHLIARDFVGIGAGSQLWTHCAQGDRLQGCELGISGPRPLVLEEDAWILPMTNCPPKVYKTRTVYSGNPAQVFYEWERHPEDEIVAGWLALIQEFICAGGQIPANLESYDPLDRTYAKTNHPREVAFNRWLFHGRAYFRPREV